MKTCIRRGVFETNSSSTHSICVATDSPLDIPKSIHFEFGEFGWESGKLKSISDKASYLYTGLVNNEREDDVNKIFDLLKSKGIAVTADKPKYETSSYEDRAGKVIKYTHGVNTGYVDHSSELKTFLDAICKDETQLMSFLFSDFSFILTGNDNDDSDVSINVNYPYVEYYKGN
jgi:hypothetical protein